MTIAKNIWLILALAALVITGGMLNSALAEAPATPEDDTKVQTAAVAKIVFIDKENCCKCTKERTDNSWDAMQEAIKDLSPAIPVEHIHSDTQAKQANQYRALMPMVTLPALYFIDEEGKIVKLLQGEVKTQEITAILSGGE